MTPNRTGPAFHPCVPTAMQGDGTLDDDGQAAVAATLASAGATGLLVLDLVAGEAASLSEDERASVMRATRRGAGGLPLAVGVGVPDTGMIARAHRAAANGADVLVAAIPPAGDRRADLLGEVASVGLPLWLHHHPAATGSHLGDDDLLSLVRELGVTTVVVESLPSPDGIAAVGSGSAAAALGGLGGLFLLEELEAGAAGTTAGSAVPEQLGPVLARHQHAPEEATDRFLELMAYLRLESGSPGLRVRKEAWRQRGVLASARVRDGQPLGDATKRGITRRLRHVGVDVRDPYPGA